MILALLAAVAMVAQDVLGSIMVMCEAANRKWLAGVFDSFGWLVAIATTTISVTALQGHNTTEKVEVVVLVSLANLFGTALGVASGNWLLHRKPSLKREDPALMVASLEARVEALESRRPENVPSLQADPWRQHWDG